MPQCGEARTGRRGARSAAGGAGTGGDPAGASAPAARHRSCFRRTGVRRIAPHLPVLLGCLLVAVALVPGACRTTPAPPPAADPSPWQAAAARGVDFRAVGNEPGWFLELEDGVQIVLVTDYGRRRYEAPAPEPVVDEAARQVTFRTESRGQGMVVTLAPGPCEDTMSGEVFDTTVTVTIAGETLRGCGRALS